MPCWSRQSIGTELGTLDAIRLALSFLLKEMTATEIAVATHNQVLGLSARAPGLSVVGLAR
jgi:hypothetical protein